VVHDFWGTHTFAPPQVTEVDKKDMKYDNQAADVWALGIIFYALLYERMPEFQKGRLLCDGQEPYLIIGMLQKEESRRLTMDEVKRLCL
jgi:serine/threonine protein kinase